MKVKELLATLQPNAEISIDFYWLPAHQYSKDPESGEWVYRDGNTWVAPVALQMHDDDPNEPELDEEYSFKGPAGEFTGMVEGYGDWLLEEDVQMVSDGKYEIRKVSQEA